jgi:hypothetical protein
MAITVPKFYPRPWATNEQLPELTEGEMIAAFPSGDEQRPTRQTLNRALQYATNGIIYFLTHGVPELSADASADVMYAVGSIVRSGNNFYLAVATDSSTAPAPWMWEPLPWRKDALDAIYLTMEFGDAHFLSFANADERFYPKAQMDALFITPSKMALLYVTQAALAAEYITREQAVSMFLTVAIADERFAIYEETVSAEVLTEMLEEYLTIADGKELYLTLEDETHLTRERGAAIYLTSEDAMARFEAKINAAISRYRPEAIYSFGVLAFDPETRMIYRSLVDDNVGHPLDDEEYWTEWTLHYAEPTGVGTWLHTLEYAERGAYTINLSDVLLPETETHGEILMRFRLKAGGGGGYGIGGGGEGAGLTVMAVIEESAFPLKLMVGGPGQDSSIGSIGAPLLQVNCGGDAVETWSADHGYDGGGYASNDNVIDLSKVEYPAPMEVYQSARFPIDTWFIAYTFSGFVPNAPCVVRLHFCEGNPAVVPGERVFDVDVNGQRVLTNFDVVARAGGPLIAHIESFVVPADAQGQYVIVVWTRLQAPIISGIEILALTTLLSVQPGNDATEEEPGLGGDQAMVGLARGIMSVVKIPGAHGRFAWPGFRSGDGGGNGGGSGEPLRRVNCAGDVIGTWGADAGFGGGGGHGDPHPDLPIDTSRAFRPAPEAIYRTVRMDDPTPLVYTFGGYEPGSHQVVRLHFCELWTEGDWPHRRFRVVVNDVMILEQFNIIEAAGGARIANVQTALAAANAQGQIVITFTPIAHPPIIAGIEIFAAEPIPSSMIPFNCGGDEWLPVEGWADRWWTGGLTISSDHPIDTSRVTRPAPPAIYMTCRFGGGINGATPAFRYIIPPTSATPGWVYRLRLHFCECWAGVGDPRIFHVAVNNRWIVQNLNVAERAGGNFNAYILETDVMANSGGLDIWVQGLEGLADPILNGIEFMWMGSPADFDWTTITTLGGGGNSEWGPSVRPGAAGFIFVDW